MRHENQGHTCIPAIWNRQLVWSGACTHRWAAGLESSCKQGLALTERIDLSLGLSIHLDTQKSHVAALTHHSPMLIPISHLKGQKQNMEKIRSRWKILGKVLRPLFWTALLLLVVVQFWKPAHLDAVRADVVRRFQEQRKSRVIVLIHGEDTISLFGVPFGSFINMEDSESILRAIRLTPSNQPIDFILHTPGGLVLAAEQIAHALAEHKGKVTVFVPHYAMSGGTLIALTADEIVMDPNAVLGPVDPQIGDMPAASIIKVIEQKPIERVSDQTVILADMARKAQAQVYAIVNELL